MPRKPPGPAVPLLLAALVLVGLGGCANTHATWASGADPSSPGSAPGSPVTPGPSASGQATAIPATRPPASPSPKVLTLAEYLVQIPKFPPPPTPVKVSLSPEPDRAAWRYSIPTTQKVAFLTIDDGMVRHPMADDLLRRAKIPVTLFLTTNMISGHTGYFSNLVDAGAVVEGHTVSHPHLPELTYEQQRDQLCHSTDLLEAWFGHRPVFFRPPYGEQNDDTLRAAWECGLKAGFHWRQTVDRGVVRYQSGSRIRAGDIVLMHFRPAFPDDFIAALKAIKAAGLTPALLADYVDVN